MNDDVYLLLQRTITKTIVCGTFASPLGAHRERLRLISLLTEARRRAENISISPGGNGYLPAGGSLPAQVPVSLVVSYTERGSFGAYPLSLGTFTIERQAIQRMGPLVELALVAE